MRTHAANAQPGDAELTSFADQIHRPLLIVGNGPSATLPPTHLIPADPVIFRMNWFFLESHYHLGSHVDAWFFAVPNQSLEQHVAEEIRSGRYRIDRLCSPMQLASHRDGDRWGNELLGTRVAQLDHWAVIARHPRLARFFMSRPGLPTTGMQALGFGLGVGFRDVYLSGIDLYESTEARYGWTVPETVAAGLTDKDLAPGYEDAHGVDSDLAFLRGCLAEFPDARVNNLSESVNLAGYLDRPAQPDGPSLAERPAPDQGEPKERIVITLPRTGKVQAISVPAARDKRLWSELDGKRCAYVTVVSGAYHHGARALANSLRRVSSVPLLALCTADTDRAGLAASDIHVIDVPEIRNPNPLGTFQRRFAATYTKLNVFRLDFLDRLVYLDADTVVKKNIDELFGYDTFAAAPDAGLDRPSPTDFNSGVFAAQPSYELFHRLLDRLPRTRSNDGGDQGFLNEVFPDWQRLPQEYNTTKRLFSHHPALYVDADVKVLHYVGVKPWEPSEVEGRYEELDQDWLSHLEAWELRELIRDLRAAAREAVAAAVPSDLPLLGPLTGSPFRQAQQLNAARRFAQAEATLLTAWQTKSPTVAELRELARAQRNQGKHAEAAGHLRRAVELQPGSRLIARELRRAQLRALSLRVRALAPVGRSEPVPTMGESAGTPRPDQDGRAGPLQASGR